MIADNEKRNKRLRGLIRKLNQERKKQTQKMDILCNDLIAAQRQFIKRLNIITFTANFYESLIGSADLEDLLYNAARTVKADSSDANVTFFLRHEEDPSTETETDAFRPACRRTASTNFELHMFESIQPIILEQTYAADCARAKIENCFSPELMDSICKANRVCTLDDLFAMDLQGHLTGWHKLSAVTLPLALFGSLLGFMLIYRSSENPLTADEIDRLRAITGGLSRAIVSCQTLSRERSQERSRATE
jgi:hypothetical protein